MKRKLIEYKIEIPAETKDIKNLWRKFLKKDLHWHFALEGRYFELRTSGINRELEKYLKKKKWKFTKRPYINNTPITRKYQDCFDNIYHGYAMLAIALPRDYTSLMQQRDCYRVMERIIHLAFNNLHGLGLGKEHESLWPILGSRTFMAGYNAGYIFRGYDKKLKENK